jgi:putative ABC transport system permease protein
MWGLSVRSVRHHAPLFLGTFVSLVLGVALIGVTSAALVASWNVPQPARSGNPAITVKDGRGHAHTLVGGELDFGGIQTVLILAGVVSAFITVFVIAGTCAFSVALRRQDLGLLRLVGAGGPQVRRMVIGECVAVALPAALTGCLIAAVATPWAVGALNRTDLSPAPLPEAPLAGPLLFAAGAGLLIAVLGAFTASKRAARVRPVEALREASLDTRAMTAGRWTMGLLLLLAGSTMVVLAPGAGMEASIPLALFGSMALTLAATSLGPVYLPFLTRLVTAPFRARMSVPARLAVESLATARLRTASLVGPVLAIVAIVGTFTSVLGTTDATVKADDRRRTVAQLVVEPASGEELNKTTLVTIRQEPRVAAVSTLSSFELAVADKTSVRKDRGAVADLPELARTHRVDVVEGSLNALAPDAVAVSGEYAGWYGLHVGSTLTYGLFGGEQATAKVAAVLNGGTVIPQVLLPPTVHGAPGPERASVLLDEASADDVRATARDLSGRLGVKVTPAGRWFDGQSDEQAELNALVLLVLAAPASAYALIAVAGTMVMAYSGRSREIAAMRLVGVSDRQVRRMVLWEAVATTTLGVAVAAVVSGLGLEAYRSALRDSYAAVPLGVPWATLLGLVAACLAVAVITGRLAIRRSLGQDAVAQVAARQ